MKLPRRGEQGFTLIELIVVMVIIGVLAAIAIPVFLNRRQQARMDTASRILHQDYPQASIQKTSYDGPSNDFAFTGVVDFGDFTQTCTFRFQAKTMQCQGQDSPRIPAPTSTPTAEPSTASPAPTVTVTQTVTAPAQ